MDHKQKVEDIFLTRRECLQRCGMGMGALALAHLMGRAGLLASIPESGQISNPLAPKSPPMPAKVKRIIHLVMNGGPSHVDTFDPKPMLDKHHGKTLPKMLKTETKTGAGFRSPFKFRKYGQSGIEVSEIFPHVAECIDDICVIRSMVTDIPNHEPAMLLINCGDALQVRPSVGSWITYGLGTENQALPGFLAMCPGGFPDVGPQNWRSAFLPGAYQGVYLNTQHTNVDRLIENIRNKYTSLKEQRRQLDLLMQLNEQHRRRCHQEGQLEARIQSFELAYRMQMEAAEAFDISKEPQYIRDMYGHTTQAKQILLARRLIERGVRFVQVYHGLIGPWDSHDDLEVDHRRLAKECDQAIGALLKDLKQRGLLEETLVIWGGEFGRTPTVELPTGGNSHSPTGRDHNNHGFTMWLAGGGVKGGCVHGATDEFGFQAVENKVHIHDLHATILWLLGFDHEKFTYRYAGRDFRLTDIHGHVVKEILA